MDYLVDNYMMGWDRRSLRSWAKKGVTRKNRTGFYSVLLDGKCHDIYCIKANAMRDAKNRGGIPVLVDCSGGRITVVGILVY